MKSLLTLSDKYWTRLPGHKLRKTSEKIEYFEILLFSYIFLDLRVLNLENKIK